MKIKQSETKQFKPFQITVETEDEAKLLWCALETPFNIVEQSAVLPHNINFASKNPGNIEFEMWQKINAVYDPRKQ